MPQLSVWEKESFFAHQDILIIGGGLAGLWSALHLKLLNPAYKITLLDRGLVPAGASTRNAGFCCFGSPSELITDAHEMGAEKMWSLVSKRYHGLIEIGKFFTDTEIDFETTGGYECFSRESLEWNSCAGQLEWLNTGLYKITGEKNVFTIADEKIAGFGFRGFSHMIENKLEGALHPGKLVQALMRRVQSAGVQILPGVEVLRYEEREDIVRILTGNDIVFTSSRLLLCTNAFTRELVPSFDIIPNRGQVQLTGPVDGLPFKGTFHCQRGYYYFRNLGSRLLIGGARNKALEDENTASMDTTTVIQDELENFVRTHLLPRTPYTITDRWSGIMGMGTEKSPVIKALSKRVYCCVRMSGMGVALAPVVAKEVALLMHGDFL